MKKLICDSCGGSSFKIQDGFRGCNYCGTQYELPFAKKMTSQNNNNVSTPNTRIDINKDVQMLLEKCRRNPSNASRYANLILDIDPTNREALRYISNKRR